MSDQKIAMLGGSFNPVHNGHLQLAEAFASKLNLHKVLMIPSKAPVHKNSSQTAPAQHRFNMCRLACEGGGILETLDIEITRDKESYTCYTLNDLKVIYKGCKIYLIVGADMFLTLDKWKNAGDIFKEAVICTVPREADGYEALLKHAGYLKELGACCEILPEPVSSVSSTLIRRMVKSGQDISGLVPPGVAEYITRCRLYTE